MQTTWEQQLKQVTDQKDGVIQEKEIRHRVQQNRSVYMRTHKQAPTYTFLSAERINELMKHMSESGDIIRDLRRQIQLQAPQASTAKTPGTQQRVSLEPMDPQFAPETDRQRRLHSVQPVVLMCTSTHGICLQSQQPVYVDVFANLQYGSIHW